MRRMLAVTSFVIAVAVSAGPVLADGADPRAPAAVVAKAKKKKKPLTATINGTFTLRRDDPDGFGNDGGVSFQQLKVVIKDAKIAFSGDKRRIASDDVPVRIEYKAEAHTADRSWHIGCDREDRLASGTFVGKAPVVVRQSRWLQTNGKSKAYSGWQVYAELPATGIKAFTVGSYEDWESILMEKCLTFGVSEPLGAWNTTFAQPDGLGKLASDNRSVPLTAINTGANETGTVTGSIRFNKPVD